MKCMCFRKRGVGGGGGEVEEGRGVGSEGKDVLISIYFLGGESNNFPLADLVLDLFPLTSIFPSRIK